MEVWLGPYKECMKAEKMQNVRYWNFTVLPTVKLEK